MLATTGFLKERGVFGPAEVVILGPADVVILGPAEVEVVIVSLGLAEVVMIIKTLDMMLAESSQSLRQEMIIKLMILMSLVTPGS